MKSYLDKPAIATVREPNHRLVTLHGENGQLRDRITALVGDSFVSSISAVTNPAG